MKIAIGVDIEKISRFGFLASKIDVYKLSRIFSVSELKYSMSAGNVDSHLAACFCAKEAAIKALSKFQIKSIGFEQIEVIHNASGIPELFIEGLSAHYDISVSISHSGNMAIASVLVAEP